MKHPILHWFEHCQTSRLEKKNLEFWCQICGVNLVKSCDTTTGHFYQVFGHEYQPEEKDVAGDFHSIIFAICNECEKSE